MHDRILITGRNGQLGRALQACLPTAHALGRDELDLAQGTQLIATLNRLSPQVIYNAAAYTAVDLAETERDLAFQINAEAVRIMGEWCAQNEATFVHYSTDYVFAGDSSRAYREDDETRPLNVYGASKLRGENYLAQSQAPHLIFRTSWVYDALGKNFFNTMLRLGSEREVLRVVSDQRGAPTYAPSLAELSIAATRKALEFAHFPTGIYHLTGGGETSWFDFAQAIFAGARSQGWALKVNSVEAITSRDFVTPAARPLNSRLQLDKFKGTFALAVEDWRVGLERCLALRKRSRDERPQL